MSRRTAVAALEQHPNLPEILGILARLAHVSDSALPRLADTWRNTVYVAEARDRALSPDSPLVLEVLCAFEAVTALFGDDLEGSADYITVDPAVAAVAVKSIRDALAAAYARPALRPGMYTALIGPWRSVYTAEDLAEPDLGRDAESVKALLGVLPLLANRCHDERARAVFESLVLQAWLGENGDVRSAREAAWRAAVRTSRRRLWALVRRSGAEGLGRACRGCAPFSDRRDEQRVLTLCLDAACALLVSDVVPDSVTDLLTAPISALVPLPRRGR